MARRRKFYVFALRDGIAVGPQVERSLERASKTANKMADQGLEEVKVLDAVGTPIENDKLDAAWRKSANRSHVKRKLRYPGQID